MCQKRNYRNYVHSDNLVNFEVSFYESDLLIRAQTILKKQAEKYLSFFHNQLREYIEKMPEFAQALTPLKDNPKAPAIVRAMIKSAQKASVGPMATVAGAIAEFVGRQLLRFSNEVIVENGGDIFISVKKECRVGIFAGVNNPYNDLVIVLPKNKMPCGICTSSGIIGHSLSFGKTNATIVIAKNTMLADGFATAVGNLIKDDLDVEAALSFAKNNRLIRGLIIVISGKLTAYGDVRFDVLDK